MQDQAKKKILFVDDDPDLLAGIRRQLRREFDILTAEGGDGGLDVLQDDDAVAVVVSDMRMPGMNGVEFLEQVRKLSPDTVRIMLTGYADLETAIEAVNSGKIFQFLTKPISSGELKEILRTSLEYHHFITMESMLLEQTLIGSIRSLLDILSMVQPAAFRRALRIRRHAKPLAERLKIASVWEIELAATLSQIGHVAGPRVGTHNKIHRGRVLTSRKEKTFDEYPEIGYHLIKNIPRLEKVARIILYQEKHYDGSGFPHDDVRGEAIPLGARILKIVLDFDKLISPNTPLKAILHTLQGRSRRYDPRILQEFMDMVGTHRGAETIEEMI